VHLSVRVPDRCQPPFPVLLHPGHRPPVQPDVGICTHLEHGHPVVRDPGETPSFAVVGECEKDSVGQERSILGLIVCQNLLRMCPKDDLSHIVRTLS
jgi:hypothetical protein